MGTARNLLLSLALTYAGVHGYIPSKHPATKRVDIENIAKTLQQTSDVPLASRKPLQLEPVFDRNPLEKIAKSQDANTVISVAVPVEVQQQQPAVPVLSRAEKRYNLFAAASAAMAGFTDVLCLSKFNCIANMMTGNVLKAASALANGRGGEASVHALVVFAYMLGGVVFSTIKRNSPEGEDSQLGPLRLVSPIVLSLFVGADIAARHCGGSMKALQVPCLALGFGLVNSAAAHATGGTIFFALTGHLTKIANWLNDAVRTRNWKLDAMTQKSVRVSGSFFAGALVAAVGLKQMNGMGLPVCTTLGLLYASLFGWYSPLTPLVKRRLENSIVGRMVKPAFASIRRLRQRAGLMPSPVVVEVFPAQDFLFAANGTISAYSGF